MVASPVSSSTPVRQFQSFQELSNFLWSVADLLRVDFKAYDFGKVILPFTVLRRLDCVLAPTKEKVLAEAKKLKSTKIKNIDQILGARFHNRSPFDLKRLLDDPGNISANLMAYLLPRTKGDPIHLEGDVDLHSYRLAQVVDTVIKLKGNEKAALAGPNATGTGGEKHVDVALSSIVDLFNKRFGTDFNEGARLGSSRSWRTARQTTA